MLDHLEENVKKQLALLDQRAQMIYNCGIDINAIPEFSKIDTEV